MGKFRILSAYFCSLLVVAIVVVSPQAYAGALEKLFAPKARLWSVWARNEPASTRVIDHSAWGSFLVAYVSRGEDGISRVRYGSVTDTDRTALSSYIEQLKVTPISEFSREEQFAYWVNLYNALTVAIVLDYYPVASIQDIKLSSGLWSKGPWKKKLLVIEGKKLSLNDIEHRILRPIWQDPRVHYAVSCASIGCPNLMSQPFTGENTERLLEQGARDYINHPRGALVSDGRLHVSSIYSWFESDFGGSAAGVIDHLSRYAAAPLAKQLANISKIYGDSYDWSLNDARQ